jgi:hypothetical protein
MQYVVTIRQTLQTDCMCICTVRCVSNYSEFHYGTYLAGCRSAYGKKRIHAKGVISLIRKRIYAVGNAGIFSYSRCYVVLVGMM